MAAALWAASVLPAQVWPGAGWPTATPESQGLDGAKLLQGLRALPDGAGNGPMMVVANGYQVLTIGDVAKSQPTYSCSKLVTAMLCARLVQQGRIPSFDALVPNTVPGAWSGYQGDSSYRAFMTMTSDYGLSPYHPAGGQYAYNNNAVDFYGESMGQRFYGVGADQMHVVARRAFFDKTGAQDPITFVGQWGGWDGGLYLSTRDFARLGLLLLRDGVWKGERLLAPTFVRGLFHSQIPLSARRYDSGDPRQNNQFNQQQFTDMLGGNWSFGLWRVASDTNLPEWHAAASEGYRGKRMILFRRGSLPNPRLELLLVSLPHLRTEGPPSTDYYDAVRSAVLPLGAHPEEDPQCLTAPFDDGTTGRFTLVSGSAQVVAGALAMGASSTVRVADVKHDDADVLAKVNTLPPGGRLGVVLRQPESTTNPDPTTIVWVLRLQGDRVRVDVERTVSGNRVVHHGTPLANARANRPFRFLVSALGDRVFARVDGEEALGTGGFSGIAVPAGGGHLGLRNALAGTAVDYVLARHPEGPIGQVAVDAAGRHTLALFHPELAATFAPQSLYFEAEGLRFQGPALAAVAAWVWPLARAVAEDHVLVSSAGSVWTPLPGTGLVVGYGGLREGLYYR